MKTNKYDLVKILFFKKNHQTKVFIRRRNLFYHNSLYLCHMNIFRSLLYVAVGGAMGSVARYLLSKFVSSSILSVFPFATFVINLLGCFLIGIFCGLAERNVAIQGDMKLLWITGVCGGFTTFSTFSNESLSLLQNGHVLYGALYIAGSVFLGILMVLVGLRLVG